MIAEMEDQYLSDLKPEDILDEEMSDKEEEEEQVI